VTLFLEQQEGGYYPLTTGETMAKVKYIGIGTKELGRGKYKWRRDETIEMPAKLVIDMVFGHKDLVATFDASDKEYIVNAPKSTQKSLVKWFGLKNYHEVVDKLLGGNPAKRKLPTLKLKPKEEAIPEPEPEVEEKLEPLPPKLDKLTIKQLKPLLEERGLSTEGKKAELIERLVEA